MPTGQIEPAWVSLLAQRPAWYAALGMGVLLVAGLLYLPKRVRRHPAIPPLAIVILIASVTIASLLDGEPLRDVLFTNAFLALAWLAPDGIAYVRRVRESRKRL